jgi:deoxyguanosine kinase
MQDSSKGIDNNASSAQEAGLSHLQYVVVEGCIGVGKTTLTHLLSKRLGSRTVVEVVEENPFLPEFYRDQEAHAFKTQMFFLLSRFKQQEDIVQTDLFKRSVVADYMFAKDRIFAELTLSGSELSLYQQVFDALARRVQTPDLIIYLRAPMEIILERIARRGRSFEKDIDPDYLRALASAYQRFFAGYHSCPVLTVESEGLNFPESGKDVSAVLSAAVETVVNREARRVFTGPVRQPSLV